MRVLMVYDTVSDAKVTGQVAETIVAAMREASMQVEAYLTEDADKASIKDFDCLVVGAPTMAWRPSKRMKAYLTGLAANDHTGKKAAAFDTQIRSSVSGNATKHMERSLTAMGFKIVAPALIAYVESKDHAYRLKNGEMEKARNWGKELARILTK
jgi:flavorubredoxin